VADFGQCDICKGKLALKEKKSVADTEYNIVMCEKCKKQVVRKAE